MMEETSDILATRLNFDVIVFRGNTRQEMLIIGFIALGFTIAVLGTLTKLGFGMFLIGLGLSFPASIPVGWMIATIAQTLKAGKPKGYVKQQWLLWLDKEGIQRSPFIHRTGKWSVRRKP